MKPESAVYFKGMMDTLARAAVVLSQQPWQFTDKEQGLFISRTSAEIIRSVGGKTDHAESVIKEFELDEEE